MSSVDDSAGIRRLRDVGLPITMIARTFGISVSRTTVRAALAAERPTTYARKLARSAVDGFELWRR